MPTNRFDQASRHAAKLDPSGFLCWLLALRPEELLFRRWLDTRLIPFPGEPERISDTVAHVEDVQGGHVPWAIDIEFQLSPDSLMFGRELIYLGQIWLEQKPVEERGDRFQLGAVVVHLTGRGQAGRAVTWPRAGLQTALTCPERNLCDLDAGATLSGIASGTTAAVVLCFVPLMRGGGEVATIQRWLQLASAEASPPRRAAYGAVALVLSEAAQCQDVWQQHLQGWNMIESKVVLGWQAETRGEDLLEVLSTRFGGVPAEIRSAIQTTADLVRLKAWLKLAVQATTLDDFRQQAQL